MFKQGVNNRCIKLHPYKLEVFNKKKSGKEGILP